jgi:hypothetical protein
VARIRTIKPAFFDSESMATLSPRARLLFVALWTLADREGRLRYLPKRWVAHAFPHEDVPTSVVEELLTNKCLRMYDIDGRRYADIPAWGLHQRPPKNEAASRLPAFDAATHVDEIQTRSDRCTKGGLGTGNWELGTRKKNIIVALGATSPSEDPSDAEERERDDEKPRRGRTTEPRDAREEPPASDAGAGRSRVRPPGDDGRARSGEGAGCGVRSDEGTAPGDVEPQGGLFAPHERTDRGAGSGRRASGTARAGSLIWTAYRRFHPRSGEKPPKAAGRLIRGALEDFTVEEVVGVVEWAHESPDDRARYLRAGRYTGLDSLLRAAKLPHRVELAAAWKAGETDPGVVADPGAPHNQGVIVPRNLLTGLPGRSHDVREIEDLWNDDERREYIDRVEAGERRGAVLVDISRRRDQREQ